MKCKLIRDLTGPNPEYDIRAHRLARRQKKRYDVPDSITVPEGTEIDHPDAWRLVRRGVAVPVDDECREAAGIDDAEIQRQAQTYQLEEEGRLVGARTGDTSYDRPRQPRRRPAPAAKTEG